MHGFIKTLARERRRKILKVRKFAIKVIAILAILLMFASVMNTALAQYFPPVPTPIVVRETLVTVFYTQPKGVITIDVTQFDPQQVVKELIITLEEPVLNASFTIYLLAKRPPEAHEPKETALLYFTIRAHTALLKNVKSARIAFAVERAVVGEEGVNAETIILNRFFLGMWEELPTKKVYEDKKFLYFEAEAPGLSHFAATRVVLPPPFLWLTVVIIVVVAVAFIVAGMYLYRRRKLRI